MLHITQTDDDKAMLLSASERMEVKHNFEQIIEAISKLSLKSSSIAITTLSAILKNYRPFYDFEQNLENLLIFLAKNGERDQARILASKLKELPTGRKIYDAIVNIPIGS